MNRAFAIALLLSCAYIIMYAQDSFSNPYSFSYEIDYSSEDDDSIASSLASHLPSEGKLDVSYDAARKTSRCRILMGGELSYEGDVLDMQLAESVQTFVLEKYFSGKYDACLMVVRETEENSDIKVGMLYYTDRKEDTSPEGTCHLLFLRDTVPLRKTRE